MVPKNSRYTQESNNLKIVLLALELALELLLKRRPRSHSQAPPFSSFNLRVIDVTADHRQLLTLTDF